jgi:hypothetical protein
MVLAGIVRVLTKVEPDSVIVTREVDGGKVSTLVGPGVSTVCVTVLAGMMTVLRMVEPDRVIVTTEVDAGSVRTLVGPGVSTV